MRGKQFNTRRDMRSSIKLKTPPQIKTEKSGLATRDMSTTVIIYAVLVGVLLRSAANGEDDPYQHAVELLSKHPLIDGYYISSLA